MSSATIQSPLLNDENGVMRVGQTRVTFLSVMNAYDRGATPEEIIQEYPVLPLADVYATIAFYLQNRAEADVYLANARHKVETMHEVNQVSGLREKLQARL